MIVCVADPRLEEAEEEEEEEEEDHLPPLLSATWRQHDFDGQIYRDLSLTHYKEASRQNIQQVNISQSTMLFFIVGERHPTDMRPAKSKYKR